MLSHNFLYDFRQIRNKKLGKFLKNIITSCDGGMLNDTKFEWEYTEKLALKNLI